MVNDVSIIMPVIESVFTALGTTVFFFYNYIKKEFVTKAVFYNKVEELENKLHSQTIVMAEVTTKLDFILKSIEDLSNKVDKLRGGK